jgi:2,3,4,5-tetrahydropyridine-2-carboxylate N-succinyltransferase
MSSLSKSPSGLASGHGIATLSGATVLDLWFPSPSLGALTGQPDQTLTALVGKDDVRKVTREIISIEINLAVAPQSAADAYLRLHLLSHRLIAPHGAVMDGIFGMAGRLAGYGWAVLVI